MTTLTTDTAPAETGATGTATGTTSERSVAEGRRAHVKRGRSSGRVIGGVVLGLVFLVHTVGLLNYPALADDEGTYASQAWAARHGELAHYTFWYDHPPLGWLQLGALDWLPQLVLGHEQPVAASRLVIGLATMICAYLTLLLARRLGLGPIFAAVAVALAFLSPLAVTLQRQVYLDNLATPWVLLSFLLLLDRRQRLWQYVAAGAAFGVAALTKETTFILAPLFAWTALRYAHPRTRAFCVVGAAAAFCLTTVYYPLMALLRGELFPGDGHVSLLGGLLFQFVDRAGSGAVWQSSSGSHQVMQSWLYYDTWLIALGLAGAVACLIARRTRLLGGAVLIMTLVALKPGGYLPAMYIIVALPLLGLTAAAALQLLWRAAADRLRRRGGRVGRFTAWLPAVAVGAGLAAVAVAWAPGLTTVMTARSNDSRTAAERWMARHVPATSVVVTDDVSWLGLVAPGTIERSHAIWFYKLDTDPAVQREFPRGWRDVDYVLSTNELRLAVGGDPGLAATAGALTHSSVVASFGTGGSLVEIRRVSTADPATAPVALPAAPPAVLPAVPAATATVTKTPSAPAVVVPTAPAAVARKAPAAVAPKAAHTAPPPFTISSRAQARLDHRSSSSATATAQGVTR